MNFHEQLRRNHGQLVRFLLETKWHGEMQMGKGENSGYKGSAPSGRSTHKDDNSPLAHHYS